MNSFTIFVHLLLIYTILLAHGRKHRHCQKHATVQQKVEFLVGAHQINSSDVPYHCLMRTKYPKALQCGCSILSDWFVLSAAHCFAGLNSEWGADEYHKLLKGKIYTGINDVSNLNNGYNIQDFVVHKEFGGMADYLKSDIAVIMVDCSIQFSTYVQWIPLVGNNDYQNPGRNVYLSGYGVSDNSFQTDEHKLYGLWKTTVSCEGVAKYPERKVCARNRDPSVMKYCSGSGQSGGPLVDIKTYRLVGLLSKSFCANESDHTIIYPTEFANIYWFRDWIMQTQFELLGRWGLIENNTI